MHRHVGPWAHTSVALNMGATFSLERGWPMESGTNTTYSCVVVCVSTTLSAAKLLLLTLSDVRVEISAACWKL
jgi:hypothetical protein